VLALTVAIAVSVAAGVGAERRWGEGAQVAARWALNAMLYVALPFIAFFVVARTELTTGIAVGLVLAYLGWRSSAWWRGGSRAACWASARRRPPRWSSRP